MMAFTRGRHGPALASLALLAGCASGTATSRPTPFSVTRPAPVYVLMRTTVGDIGIELDPDAAPISVTNFLGYVDRGEYDDTLFQRVIEKFVVQGGGFSPQYVELKSGPKIANEWRNGLKNTRGTIAMARDTDPDTATREFYFNVVDNPKLDIPREKSGKAGYAVFGRVVRGMNVLDAIRHRPTTSRPATRPEDAMQDVPVTPVILLGARRASRAEALWP